MTKPIPSPFGMLHETISKWVIAKELTFEGRISASNFDDLDKEIFRLWQVPYIGIETLGEMFRAFDEHIKFEDVQWLKSDNALALFKAKLQLRGGSVITWLSKTKS